MLCCLRFEIFFSKRLFFLLVFSSFREFWEHRVHLFSPRTAGSCNFSLRFDGGMSSASDCCSSISLGPGNGANISGSCISGFVVPSVSLPFAAAAFSNCKKIRFMRNDSCQTVFRKLMSQIPRRVKVSSFLGPSEAGGWGFSPPNNLLKFVDFVSEKGCDSPEKAKVAGKKIGTHR